jgi:phosphoribosylamine---glycine ligase
MAIRLDVRKGSEETGLVMNVLVIGDGARAHALCWKLSESPVLEELYCAPGNIGVGLIAECVPISLKAVHTIASFCEENDIDFIIVSNTQTMSIGIVDMLNRNGFATFGPDMGAVRLETSKAFSREICQAGNIPMAKFVRVTDQASADAHIDASELPIVVKGDFAADGSRVAICKTKEEAKVAVAAHFAAGDLEIFLEEFLTGPEVSYCAVTDGHIVLPMTSATDDWDPDGPGLYRGSLSPAPAVTPEIEKQILQKILRPTINTMKNMRRPFKGLLNARLILTAEGPKVIDYKVRFSDPEWQAIALRINGDLIPALISSYDEMLERFDPFRWHPGSAVALVMRAEGANATTEKIGIAIDTIEAEDEDIVVYRSNEEKELNITATGTDLADVRKRLYAAVSRVLDMVR